MDADGRVSVYNGPPGKSSRAYMYLANPARAGCFAAITYFWLYDRRGLPLLVFTGELNEKLQHAIEDTLIARLVDRYCENRQFLA
jgi:hypothetical protein